ncbi:hypothetical protein [Actinotalea sp. C106]|uniref:hypothetical protein n=1 Tax=Actinotalea sp. C106 TaxID=2908644 RepID=UPI0027E123ED|nr:hypothetical protein [Actinotalea sp. C106]
MRRSLLGALVMVALFLVYIVAVVGRGAVLIGTGEPVGIGLGLAILVLPLLGLWLLARELWLATTVQRMADTLAASGSLPVDDLPRSPGGRIDRSAADAAFALARTEVEASPEDWAAWFRLGFAYDAAGDRRRARSSLRTAVRLRRSGAPRG